MAHRHLPLGHGYYRCLVGSYRIAVLVARHSQAGAASRYQRVRWRYVAANNSFCLDLSYLYSRLVQTYSKGSDHLHFPEEAPLASHANDEQGHDEEPLLPQTRDIARHAEHSHLSPSVRHFLSMYVCKLCQQFA